MLLCRTHLALARQGAEGRDEQRARLLRLDDHVDVAALGCEVRRREVVDVLLRLGFLVRVAAEDDVGRTRRTHDGNLSRRPGHDLIRAEFVAAHGDVGTAVRLARDDRDLRHRRLAVGVEHLRAVADDARVLLIDARQEARDVDERQERDVEGIAEADEARRLVRGVDVEAARHDLRLVRDDADDLAVEARVADDDVRREELLDLEELPVVDERADDILHVVRHVRVVRHDGVEALILAVRVIRRLDGRRILEVVARQVREQLADLRDAVVLVLAGEVCDARARAVRQRAAELFRRDFLSRDRLDDGRARDEHLARVLDHEDEIRDGRAVDGAARARSHDDRDLRDDARGGRIAEEDAAEARERIDALLDAGTARIVDADARRTHLEREILHLPDLVGVLLAEAAARDREVLRIGVDQTAVDRAVARDDAVARHVLLVHAEVRAAVLDEHVELDERVLVKEPFKALTRRVFSLSMLFLNASSTATLTDVVLHRVHLIDFFLNACHSNPPI